MIRSKMQKQKEETERRIEALHILKAEKHTVWHGEPKLAIGSPEWRLSSSSQNLIKHPENTEDQKKQMCEAIEHIKFVVRMYKEQAENGRLLLHEHPAPASPWNLEEIRKVTKRE